MADRFFGLMVAAGAATILTLAAPQAVDAQLFEDPVDLGGQRNGAAIAQMIERIEERDESGATGAANGGGTSVESTTVLCGGGGSDGTSSSATSNRNCIILNEANGEVQVGQDSQGDQAADADQATAGDSASSGSSGQLSDAIEQMAE